MNHFTTRPFDEGDTLLAEVRQEARARLGHAHPLPATVRHARLLSALAPEDQAEAWWYAARSSPNTHVAVRHLEQFCNLYLHRPRPLRLKAHLTPILAGADESACRIPHMHHAPPERVLRGLILEQHVAHYFARRFPSFYHPPSNYGCFTEPCDHDFQLRLADREWLVDVLGPLVTGAYGMPEHKTHTDLHLFARPCDQRSNSFIVQGFQRGEWLRSGFDYRRTQPIYILTAYLLCEATATPYPPPCRVLFQP